MASQKEQNLTMTPGSPGLVKRTRLDYASFVIDLIHSIAYCIRQRYKLYHPQTNMKEMKIRSYYTEACKEKKRFISFSKCSGYNESMSCASLQNISFHSKKEKENSMEQALQARSQNRRPEQHQCDPAHRSSPGKAQKWPSP